MAHDTSKHTIHRPRKGSDFGGEEFLPLWGNSCSTCMYILYRHEYHLMKSLLHLLPTRVWWWGGVLMYISRIVFFFSIFQLIIQLLRTRCWCIIHGTSWPPLELRQHIFFGGIRDQLTFYKSYQRYCWWKKSCTSWYGQSPTIYRVLYIPGGDRRISSTNPGSEPAGSICPEAQYSSERCQCEMSGGKLLCKNVFESIAPNISPWCFYYCVTHIYIYTYIYYTVYWSYLGAGICW